MLTSVIAALFFTAFTPAADLTGSVKVPEGVKIADDDLFVAWTDVCSSKTKAPDVELVQNDFMYAPRALVTTVGAKLHVRNGDKAQHNSFALKNVSFDSGLQKPGTTYEVLLDKPGVTKVFCRIHPKMASEVLALPNPCFRKISGADLTKGFTLPLPPGGKGGKVWLWSPRLRAFQSLAWTPGKKTEFTPPGDAFVDLPSQRKPVEERDEHGY
jgi:plastocyanin